MYPNREVFPSTPLALVAVEARFADTAKLRQQSVLDVFAMHLDESLPVVHPVQDILIETSSQGASAGPPAPGLLLRNLDNTWAVTARPHQLIIETTAYETFDGLVAVVDKVSAALESAGVSPILERIGLRYIDEIRVPTAVDDVREWQDWIDNKLIRQSHLLSEDLVATNTQGSVSYLLGDDRFLNVRYAALNQEPVISHRHLSRTQFAPGPFFVLDFDGFEMFGTDNQKRYSAQIMRDALEAVHGPSGEAFQNALTQKTRELFRKETT